MKKSATTWQCEIDQLPHPEEVVYYEVIKYVVGCFGLIREIDRMAQKGPPKSGKLRLEQRRQREFRVRLDRHGLIGDDEPSFDDVVRASESD